MKGQWKYRVADDKVPPLVRFWPTNMVLARGKWKFEADPSLKPRHRATVLAWLFLGLIVLLVILLQFPIHG